MANLLTGNPSTGSSAGLGGALNTLQPLQDLGISQLSNRLLQELANAAAPELDALATTATETLSYTVQQIANASEPQRSWKWMVQLPDILYLTGSYSVPNWMVLSITPSFINTDTSTYWIGAQPTNYPSDQSVGQVRISLYLDETLTALNYLQVWRSLVRNSDRTFNYPSVYKKPIYLTLLTSQSSATAQLILNNCFPVNASIGSLTYRGVEHMTLDITVSVDDFSMSPNPVGAVTSVAGSVFGSAFNQFLINPIGILANTIAANLP